MSKLDGNERWKSKMLLTEHQEQYDQRIMDKTSSMPTEEEYHMIRDYVLLPYMLTMVQKGVDELQGSTGVLKKLHLVTSKLVMDRISEDIYHLRREMSRRNIKVLQDDQVDLVVYYKYICRGYENKMGFVREVMRSEISKRFTAYIQGIIEQLKVTKETRKD
ncbi:hypothetical protein [Paenibacillus koleovorans]|uniref:hypothetical protein n=1 Tax=Paenibacillus koleovorans TaxID=121608 RepID=UPI000FDB428E|nr:hypothetical protein [Paenibacillus koleovorans]